MPSIYTPDPTNTAQPADSDYAYLQAGELRAIKQYLAAQLTGLGGPVNPEVLRDRAKNYLINGCCRLAEHGNKAISANGVNYGGCNRHVVQTTGFSTIAATIQQYTAQATSSSYAQGISMTTTGSGTLLMGQRSEAITSRTLAGRTVTYSARVFQNTGAAVNVNMTCYKPSALNDFTSGTLLATGSTVSVASGTWTTVSLSLTLSTSDVLNGLAGYINFTGLGAVSTKDFLISDFQLVESQFVTPFVCKPIEEEEAACARFFRLIRFIIRSGTAANFFAWITFSTPMRAVPAVSLENITYVNGSGGAAQNPSITGAEAAFNASAPDGSMNATLVAIAEIF